MKKIIALALSVLMILTCFVGCGEDAASSELANAIAFLQNMYQKGKPGDLMDMLNSTDVVSSVVVDDVTYSVEWKVEVTEGDKDSVKVIESEKENCVLIDIPVPEKDVFFTATATVKGEGDATESIKFNYKVPGTNMGGDDTSAEDILTEAYALAEGAKMEGTQTLTGKITAIDTPYSKDYKNITVTIVVDGFEDKPIQCFRLEGDGADALAVGDVITVSGNIVNYKGKVQFDAKCKMDEVVKAAKEAHAHSFIKRLPNGYETQIGEEGGNLSQGQKQLICIARVMLMNPPMLILDEATSSIDLRTEQKIQLSFEKLMKGKTSFIIAHRLSTIKNADIILVMKNGNIIEQGTHNELIEQNGFYANLYVSQFNS